MALCLRKFIAEIIDTLYRTSDTRKPSTGEKRWNVAYVTISLSGLQAEIDKSAPGWYREGEYLYLQFITLVRDEREVNASTDCSEKAREERMCCQQHHIIGCRWRILQAAAEALTRRRKGDFQGAIFSSAWWQALGIGHPTDFEVSD
jgi:hypothetical protein